jgi:hypothetical protein
MSDQSPRSYRPPQTASAPPAYGHDEPEAAVNRRRGAGRDLFAVDDQAPNYNSADASNLTAERNENSVLFNVNTLRAAMEAQHSEQQSAQDDGGQIDLRALTSSMGGSLEYKPLALAEPPMAAFLAPASDVPEQAAKGKGPLFFGAIAGGALVFVGIVTVGLVFALSEDVAMAARRAPNVRVESLATDDQPIAKAPEAKVEVKAAGGGFRGGPVGKPGKPGAPGAAGAGAGAGASTPPPPKKPSDPCGCHGQLECVMRCSAK